MIDLYNLHRNKIETGDIIEFRANSFIGRIIRAKTGQMVNHTAMAFRYVLEGDTEPRITISEAVNDGVQPHFLSTVLDGYDGEAYLTKLKPEYDSYRIPLAKAMLNLEGTEYDYWDLLRNLRGPVRVDKGRLFCSEACQVAAIECELLPEYFANKKALVPGEFGRTGVWSSQKVRIF